MMIKVVGGSRQQLLTCEHISITRLPNETVITLKPSSHTIKLPHDGDKVYVMNDRGDTVDSFVYTPPLPSPANDAQGRNER